MPPLRNSGCRTICVIEGGFGLSAAAIRRRLELRDLKSLVKRMRRSPASDHPEGGGSALAHNEHRTYVVHSDSASAGNQELDVFGTPVQTKAFVL